MMNSSKRIFLLRLFSTIFGQLFCAIAISFFFVPHKLLSGGIGGVSIMLQYITNISTGVYIAILNLPIFIYGYKKLSKSFMLFTFLSYNLLSVYLMAIKAMNLSFQLQDAMLSSIAGGVLNGIGMGLMFRNGSSQGGLDIIAMILKKERNMNIGSALMAMNMLIVLVGSYLFGIEKGLYTIIAMYIGYACVDKVIVGFDVKKQVIIISKKPQEIANKIMNNPHRGVTLLEAKGAYTGESKQVIYCIASNNQISKIKQVINEVDPSAFMSIASTNEVKGRGFVTREY